MRVAVISDIHGNALALDAVLADIERHGVDAILNLGDHFFGPLQPGRVWERLSGIDMRAITGNTDRYLTEAAKSSRSADREALKGLPQEAVDWLATLPATSVFEDAIFLSHGAPASDDIQWLDRDEGDHMRVSTEAEIVAELPEGDYPLYCCGHTHVARVVTLADGRVVFNPGSVGRPSFTMGDPDSRARLSPAAAYAVVEKSAGKWHVNLRQVAYDNMAASAMARAHGSLEWALDLAHGRER